MSEKIAQTLVRPSSIPIEEWVAAQVILGISMGKNLGPVGAYALVEAAAVMGSTVPLEVAIKAIVAARCDAAVDIGGLVVAQQFKEARQ